VNIAYNKALLMFEAVRVSMGDEKFFACLKDYFTENIYTLATPEHLIAAFARRADVEGVFSSFLEGKIII
jgi:aminopeptidase N